MQQSLVVSSSVSIVETLIVAVSVSRGAVLITTHCLDDYIMVFALVSLKPYTRGSGDISLHPGKDVSTK